MIKRILIDFAAILACGMLMSAACGSDNATPDNPGDSGTEGSGTNPPVVKIGDYDSVEARYTAMGIPSAEEGLGALAFPGAEGGGMYTSAGRGGTVYHVTSLADSGSGTLREALGKKGARTIVFDLAGVIELNSALKISNGNVYIAGQTAPGDGICIKNYRMEIQADSVAIRYLHFRLGDQGPDAGDSEDCLNCRYHKNIIIDHCSMSWSIDECASFYANANMTLQWCILTESMNDSAHSKGSHGYGGIWGGKDATFHHNLLANHHSRNPRPDHPEIYPDKGNYTYNFDLSNRGNVDFRNLVIYNWGDNSTYGGEGGNFNLVNCYYKPGPDSGKDRYYFWDAYSIYKREVKDANGKKTGEIVYTDYGYPSLYMTGNMHMGHADMSTDNTAHGVYWHDESKNNYTKPSSYTFRTSQWPVTGPAGQDVYTTTHDAATAQARVLASAGDVLHRDAVDTRAVDGVRNNNGKIINTPADVGGWPTYSATDAQKAAIKDSDGDGIPDKWEDQCGLDKTDKADGAAKTIDTKGRYTNLEMYLHYLTKDITSAQTKSGTYTNIK